MSTVLLFALSRARKKEIRCFQCEPKLFAVQVLGRPFCTRLLMPSLSCPSIALFCATIDSNHLTVSLPIAPDVSKASGVIVKLTPRSSVALIKNCCREAVSTPQT